MIDLHEQICFFGRIVLAAFLGSLIGLERERTVGLAGIRTHATVAIGACLFGLISVYANDNGDPTRIAAQIVSGIGFLGAGVILRDKGRVRGLTTAATVWATASVGLAIAVRLYLLASCTALLMIGILWMHKIPGWVPRKIKTQRQHWDELGD